MTTDEFLQLQREGKIKEVTPPTMTIGELSARIDEMTKGDEFSAMNKEEMQIILQTLRMIKKSRTTVPTNIPKNFLQQIEFFDNGTEKRLYLFINNAWTKIASNKEEGTGIYMFTDGASDIATYKQMVAVENFTIGTLATVSQTVSTTPTLLVARATNTGFPGAVTIPAGEIDGHFETQKTAGANNYYIYFELYKRSSGGTETLITTSDNSSQTAVNTIVQWTISAFVNHATILLATDRLVMKVYAVMLASTATITARYDDNTNARIEFPYFVYS